MDSIINEEGIELVTVAGGSHTNFDTASFTAGAFGGASMVAGALSVGISNLAAQRQARWAGWTFVQLRTALDLSEALRERLYCQLREAQRQVADRDRCIADMRRLALTATANRKRS